MADSSDVQQKNALSNFIWSIADLLRGPYRRPQYERVVLPMVVLRRLDAVLDGPPEDRDRTRDAIKAEYLRLKEKGYDEKTLDVRLNKVAGQLFHNRSGLSFRTIKNDPDQTRAHLEDYIEGFDAHVRDIFAQFKFREEIERMDEFNVLHLVVSAFADIDLHPKTVDTTVMGLVFEDLIRRFNEAANETAGDHFTPRDVVALLVRLLFEPDNELGTGDPRVVEILDPTCGTGGMLAEAHRYLEKNYPDVRPYLYGQDFNPRAYAMAASDLLLKYDPNNPAASSSTVELGDSLVQDAYPEKQFEYFLANPPFGVDWKRQKSDVERERSKRGYDGRFGAGTPRVSDGALLFVQHMVSKFEDYDPAQKEFGSRMAVVLNGSPLFTGGPTSGESTIRRWLMEGEIDEDGKLIPGTETDYIDTIVALPEQLFYNTGIGTYVWVLSNRKPPERAGTVRLVDARERYHPMPRSLGDKRRYMTRPELEEEAEPTRELRATDIETIMADVVAEEDSDTVKTFDHREFGKTHVTVERPLRLRVQLSPDAQALFLDAAPHRVDDLRRIDAALGREPTDDYNRVEAQAAAIIKKAGNKWLKADWKAFRAAFTETDPGAAPVVETRKPLKKDETLADGDRRAGWHRVEEGAKAYRVRYEADPDLRDVEMVPLLDDVDAFFEREVRPNVPDAWMDRSKDRVGYEINFNRYFYRFEEPRDLETIDDELEALEEQIAGLLAEVTA